MDRTDIILCELLLADSRTSYRELADKLGLSVNAVHKRIQMMMDIGVIREFTARLSLSGLQGLTVVMFGKSEPLSLDEVKRDLQASGKVYWLAVTGADFLIVGAYLKNLGELESCIRFVKETCHMASPFIGIMAPAPLPHPDEASKGMQKIDYKIVASLHSNSRKTISQVAAELSLSAKTVRRRLAWMERNQLLEFSIDWYPDASNDIMTLFQIFVTPGNETWKIGTKMVRDFSPNFLFPMLFNNAPEVFFAFVWTPTTKELRQLCESLDKYEGVQRIVPNIIYSGFIFETWRDRIIEEKGSSRGSG